MTGLLAALLLSLSTNTEPGCLVIAHRGASAYLPEHTLEAYALAYGQGADFIEPDVVLTADGVLVCSHDVTVPNKALMQRRFPHRVRDDDEWYFVDFTLDELRCLGRSLGRDADRFPGLQLATLDDCLRLIDELNRSTGREVGVIPEPKNPAFHRESGQPIEEPLVDMLGVHGCTAGVFPAVIQCFELESLRFIREDLGCDLPLVFLSGDPIDDATLDDIASFADGIGPSWKLIEHEEGGVGEDPSLLQRASARGLDTYVYTFNTDADRQQRFIDLGATGLFTNNPDVTRALVDRRRSVTPPKSR